jgi:methyltransferase
MLELFGYIVIAMCVVQRLLEVVHGGRNTKALLARGGVEIGRDHYPVMVALHTAWLIAVVVMLPHPFSINWFWLAIFVVLQALRIWILIILGPYWTTRIITLPDTPLVKRGPYRFMRHPNYAVVAGEILAFPLVFGELGVALIFSVLNAAMLYWRIREEDRALNERRVLAGSS